MHLMLAKKLAKFLDDKYEFMGIKFGFDPLLGLVPWLGGVITAGLSVYIVLVGMQMKLPTNRIIRMIVNIIIDFLIGLIPVAGAIATVFYRSNRMNIGIIEDYLRGDKVEEGVIV